MQFPTRVFILKTSTRFWSSSGTWWLGYGKVNAWDPFYSDDFSIRTVSNAHYLVVNSGTTDFGSMLIFQWEPSAMLTISGSQLWNHWFWLNVGYKWACKTMNFTKITPTKLVKCMKTWNMIDSVIFLCHLQKSVGITSSNLRWKQNNIMIKFEWWWKNR